MSPMPVAKMEKNESRVTPQTKNPACWASRVPEKMTKAV
jgi:hypothetical protein